MQKLKEIGNVNDLLKLIKMNQIDTINLGFPDQYGRLIGKKIPSEFFQEEVLKEGTSVCKAMLGGCDIDYQIKSEIEDWDSGYGDFHMKIDQASVRNHWIDGQALVICDLHQHKEGPLVREAPRNMLK